MKNQPRRRKAGPPQTLTLPELDQSKVAVLNSLGSSQSRRSYRHAMEEFITWYCSEPRLALNRSVVLAYRQHLEGAHLAPATINVRLAAIRRLTYEASDRGLLSADLVAGIRRVKGVKKLGHPHRELAHTSAGTARAGRAGQTLAPRQTGRRNARALARLRAPPI
jgi:hypothetical protein